MAEHDVARKVIGLRAGKCFASSTMRWACLRACRSEPQMPQASDLTSTMPAPGFGSGIWSTTISPFRKIAARIGGLSCFFVAVYLPQPDGEGKNERRVPE